MRGRRESRLDVSPPDGGGIERPETSVAGRCVLCESGHIRELEHVRRDDVNAVWRRVFGMEDVLDVDVLSYLECRTCGLRFFTPPAPGGPELYEHLQRYEWYYLPDKPEFDLALPHLSDARTVLEIGAGTGSFADHVGDRDYVGLEQNTVAARMAREAGREVRVETVEEHAEKGRQYDAVVAFQVLEHVPAPASFLRAAAACVAPGGRLVLAVPSEDGFVGGAVNDPLNAPPHHVTRWADRTLEHVAELFGLELVTVQHEAVADIHRRWANKVAVERRLRRLLGLGHSLIDMRWRGQLASRLADRMSRRLPVPRRVHGHTVVAVYAAVADGG